MLNRLHLKQGRGIASVAGTLALTNGLGGCLGNPDRGVTFELHGYVVTIILVQVPSGDPEHPAYFADAQAHLLEESIDKPESRRLEEFLETLPDTEDKEAWRTLVYVES
jgi:hypothetical protein